MEKINFPIGNHQPISRLFLDRGITDFHGALQYIKQLPYKRNSVKNDPAIAIREQCGTCSTKHAVLCELARENHHPEVKLMMGVYKMNARNTPRLKDILEKYQLAYLPEAHNYLLIHEEVIDMTMPGEPLHFLDDLLEETELEPAEIGTVKISRHREFLRQWIVNENIPYNLEETWNIREQCILHLSL